MFPAFVLEVSSDSGLHYTIPAPIGGSAEHIYFFQYALLGTPSAFDFCSFPIKWATKVSS